NGNGCKAGRSTLVGSAHDDEQKCGGKHDFNDQAGHHGVAAGGVCVVTVGGQAAGQAEAILAAGNNVQEVGGQGGTDNLGNNVGRQFFGVEASAGCQTDRNGRVQVAARNMANGVGHGQYGQAKGQS